MSEYYVIFRAGPPSLFDKAPYLHICKSEDGQIYVQESKDEDIPDWTHIGNKSDEEIYAYIDSVRNNDKKSTVRDYSSQ